MKAALNVLFFIFCFTGSTRAQTATQTVTIVVAPATIFSVSSGQVSLTNRRVTNLEKMEIDGEATYSITSTGSSKITASLGAPYTSDISLALNMAVPEGAISTGSTLLTTTAQEMVKGISTLGQTAVGILYTASFATAALPVGAVEPQTITLTITD